MTWLAECDAADCDTVTSRPMLVADFGPAFETTAVGGRLGAAGYGEESTVTLCQSCVAGLLLDD